MNDTKINNNYTDLLEAMLNASESEELLNSTFSLILKIFNIMTRVQIWEPIFQTNEYSVYYEFLNKDLSSMIKHHVPYLPESTKKDFENTPVWEYENIECISLNKFNISSLIATEISIQNKNNFLLVLTTDNKDLNLTIDDKKLFIKLAKLFEKEFSKIEDAFANNDKINRLQNQNTNLREQEQLRKNLINNISHELKTPLASILGFSNMLVSKELNQVSSKEIAEQIFQAAKRLSSIITDFLHINKTDTEGWYLNLEMCDIGEIIKESVEEFSSLYKEFKIIYHISNNYPIIKTDPKLVRQVLDNLISNSIKYSPSCGNIIVTLDIVSNNKEIIVSITDQGIGIDKDEFSKLFNRFYRSNNPQVQKVSGTGLGLAICKEIITALSGTIEVKSEPNKGSKFSFTLPV